jgi:hypothetical protein
VEAESVMTSPRLCSVREFAGALGVSLSGAWRILRLDPDAPQPLKVGALTRLNHDDVQRFVEVLAERSRANQGKLKSAGARLAERRRMNQGNL